MVKQQIESRMKAKNLSVAKLERLAVLKIHAVRNILTGKSKHPNAETLVAIAKALDCTILDLLERKDTDLHSFKRKGRNCFIVDLQKFNQCLQIVREYTIDQEVSLSLDEFFELAMSTYHYTFFDSGNVPDHRLLRWILRSSLHVSNARPN